MALCVLTGLVPHGHLMDSNPGRDLHADPVVGSSLSTILLSSGSQLQPEAEDRLKTETMTKRREVKQEGQCPQRKGAGKCASPKLLAVCSGMHYHSRLACLFAVALAVEAKNPYITQVF